MDLTIHLTFLPHDDPDASLAFHRDRLVATDTDPDGNVLGLLQDRSVPTPGPALSGVATPSSSG